MAEQRNAQDHKEGWEWLGCIHRWGPKRTVTECVLEGWHQLLTKWGANGFRAVEWEKGEEGFRIIIARSALHNTCNYSHFRTSSTYTPGCSYTFRLACLLFHLPPTGQTFTHHICYWKKKQIPKYPVCKKFDYRKDLLSHIILNILGVVRTPNLTH